MKCASLVTIKKLVFNEETEMKSLTKIILPATILLSSSFVHADQAELNRVKSLASYMILAITPKANEGKENYIKFTAAIGNISDVEAAKRLQDAPPIPTPAEQLKQAMSEQIKDPNDQKLVGAAIDNFIGAQSDILRSCKVQANVSQPDANSYKVPLKCKIPNINWATVQKPVINEKDGEAKGVSSMMNWTTNILKTSPKKDFDTAILIHKQGDQLLPDMDDQNYFPGSMAEMMGAHRSEMTDPNAPPLDDQGEDAATE